MKKVLIISSSPRRGNSDEMCDEFARGAKESGNEVEKIRLAEVKVGFCRGCDYCSTHGKPCVQDDDANRIIDKMTKADVIVLASPVYFYSICAQLKALIDRCCGAYQQIANKEFYYVLTAADTDESMMARVVETLRGFTLDCLPGAVEKGTVCGLGVWHKGEIAGNPALDKAYKTGLKV